MMTKYIRLKACLLIFLVVFSTSQGVVAATKYIALNGTDHADCAGGYKLSPWRTLINPDKNGCIKPGDRIVFLPGVYTSESGIFEKRISLKGAKNEPIVIDGAGFGNLWPVKFQGPFLITSAAHLVIEGVEFRRNTGVEPIISIGTSNVTLRKNKIHGLNREYNVLLSKFGDCVKIAGGAKHVENVVIEDNEIYECAQDAIDVTGRTKVTISRNNIYRSRLLQIKGGSRDIKIFGNRFSDMRYGITGNGMDCRSESVYCGNNDLLELAVADRYSAANIEVRDNEFENIFSGRAVDFTGWKDAVISNNRIVTTNPMADAQIRARGSLYTVYNDKIAMDYCRQYPRDCTSCRFRNGQPCQRVIIRSKNIRIEGNVITGPNNPILIAKGGLASNPNLCIRDNNWDLSKSKLTKDSDKYINPLLQSICKEEHSNPPSAAEST